MKAIRGKRGRPRDRLYRPLYRDLLGMVAPVAFGGFSLALFFSAELRSALGADRVKVDLIALAAGIYASWQAGSRFFSDRPLVAIRDGKLDGHWTMRRLPVALGDIRSVTMHRKIPPWLTGGGFGHEPRYWLRIEIAGKKPWALCLSPGQVLGGLMALRRFAEALRCRREEWEKRPKERDIYDEIWGR